MKISQDVHDGLFQIKSYHNGVITIDDNQYKNSLIVSCEKLIDTWRPQNISEVLMEDFDVVLNLKPQLILFGSGETFQLLPPQITVPLMQKGIGVECMDTKAACRTYTALLAEGREVVAALLV